MDNEIAHLMSTRRERTSPPMPWLLIALVLFTTAAAVAAPSEGERLAVLAIAEALIVAYFCVALRRLPKPTNRKTSLLEVDGERSSAT